MPLQILSNPIHFYGNLYRVKNRHNNKPVKYLGSRILPPYSPIIPTEKSWKEASLSRSFALGSSITRNEISR